MKKLSWMISVGVIAFVLASCNQNQSKQAEAPKSAPQNFPNPTVPSAQAIPAPNLKLPSVKVAGLIQPTDSKARPAIASSSNRDPFAPASVPLQLQAKIQPKPPAQRPAPQPVAQTVPVPAQISTQPIAALPQPQPVPVAAQTLPSLAVAPIPTAIPVSAPSRTHLAEAIDITGIMQVAGKLTAIVQEPSGGARYVTIGDALANGQVIVKRINIKGGEPSIVLQQNGIELIKTVGKSS